MILSLRVLFSLVLVSMLGVTSWASLQCPLFAVPREVYAHPWFIATLFDAYWGFITFYVWVLYKETSGLARAVWLVAILLLGNIAMAAYCLRVLFRVPSDAAAVDLLTQRYTGVGVLGPVLAVVGVGVIAAVLPYG
jgi:hypothetical protein